MRRALLLGLSVAALSVLLFVGSNGSAASSSCRWSLVASLGVQRDGLFGVAAESASSVWVVGTHWLYPNYNPSFTTPVVVYWNGKGLSFVKSPGGGSVATFGGQAWTVGWSVGRASNARKVPPTLLWKGPKWAQVPNPAGLGSSLNGVTMVSARDVWAIGGASDGEPLVLHWDGSRWSKLPVPDGLGTDGNLTAVARIPGTSQVWVSGIDQDSNGIVARWTGSGWETFNVRVGGGRSGSLAAASSSSAWVVGGVTSSGSNTRNAIYHWDGSAWTEVPAPSPSATHNSLTGVAVRSDSDAWAVGSFATGKKVHAQVLHWDGSRWSRVTAPGVALTAVSTVPETREVWAVGSTGEIERYRC
jgi:hypothetical protein